MQTLKKNTPDSLRAFYHFSREKFLFMIQEVEINLAKLKRQFFRPTYPKSQDGKINLHLGCGSINHPEFINIDGLPYPHIHYVQAIDKLSQFKTESVDFIYASHCLEHFPHRKVPDVLREWFRVLRKGGTLRISVPDFDLLLEMYHESNHDIDVILPILMGGQDYKFNFHMVTFTQKSLEKQLNNAGFVEVRDWLPEFYKLMNFKDCSTEMVLIGEKEIPVSLNIEAIK